MKEQAQKQILLCVAGMTPQIITETLYVLTQERNECIDEIRVITTLAGRDKIMKDLLDKEQGKFFELCRDYRLDPARISFDETSIFLLHTSNGSMLEDIRSVEDNESAANQICEIARELTKDPDMRLHASAAGGRKTMSIYLTAAMQLFGRAQDRLSHVLVSEDFETHPDFFYIPPTPRELEIRDRQGKLIKRISTAEAKIHLADIPFIRLRGVVSDWLRNVRGSYSDFVRRAQEDLDIVDSIHDLRIDVRNKTVMVASRSAKLTERELFVYLLFAHLRKQDRGSDGFVSLDEISCRDLETVFRRITSARGTERGLEDYESVPRFDFVNTFARQVASQKPKDCEDFKTSFGQIIAKIKNKFETAELPDRCLIARRGERGSFSYGLSLLPERITLL